MTLTDSYRYFAIIDSQGTLDHPAGLVRRHEFGDGGFVDEGLRSDMNWHRTPLIVEWERAESTDDLVEVSADEAERIIDRLRTRWADLG
jgi:hypothetical protein